RPVVIALMAAVAVVLIVSCLNAAALVVSWLASRQRDTALRQALGASRFRIMGQFLLESSTLAGLAGAVGVLLAAGMLDVVQRTLAAELPPGIVLSVDRLALTLALAAVVFS